MTIWLVRHGQTAFNAEGRYQGRLDSPLTQLGLEQASRIGHLIGSETKFEGGRTLWASPLGRARHTADIIQQVAGIAAPIQIDERLAEVSLGSWDGLTDEDIAQVSPGACDGASRSDWFFRSPDGEAYGEVVERLSSWLTDVRCQGGCHIVVSHGLTGRILRGIYASLPKSEALKLDVPQDAAFRLQGSTVQQFVVAGVGCDGERTSA